MSASSQRGPLSVLSCSSLRFRVLRNFAIISFAKPQSGTCEMLTSFFRPQIVAPQLC